MITLDHVEEARRVVGSPYLYGHSYVSLCQRFLDHYDAMLTESVGINIDTKKTLRDILGDDAHERAMNEGEAS